MTKIRGKGFLIALVLGALVCSAVSQVTAQDKLDADNAYRNRDWPNAIDGYRRAVRSDPGDGRSWYRLGLAHHFAEQFTQAISAFSRAIEEKYFVHSAHYYLACSHARAGHKAQALQALEHAIEAGYTSADLIQLDTDLESIRNTPEFQGLIRRAELPVMYYSEGRKPSKLSGAWDIAPVGGKSGTMTANVVAKGFSRQVDVVIGGVRTLHLFMYFVAPDNQWRVAGADSDGSVFDGAVIFDGETALCNGKRMVGGNKEEVRVKIDLNESQNGKITSEVKSGVEWSPGRTFELTRMVETDGGR